MKCIKPLVLSSMLFFLSMGLSACGPGSGGSGGVGGAVGAGGGTTATTTTFSGTESVRWSFGGTGDGTFPYGSLIQASDGNLYGMTEQGGANNAGTIFELIPGTTPTEKVLWSFGGTGDGTFPYGSLIQASDGNLYGMTEQGGANNAGTVFELIPGTTPTEKVLWSFGSSGDGMNPWGSLIQASDGNLYGMTYGGGNGFGTVFQLIPGTIPTEKVLWSFSGTGGDGIYPYGSLIQASDGNLYGMTYGGGNGFGTVFQLIPGTTPTEKVLWSFGGTGDGTFPHGSLIQTTYGNLYGMTHGGGINNGGTIIGINYP